MIQAFLFDKGGYPCYDFLSSARSDPGQAFKGREANYAKKKAFGAEGGRGSRQARPSRAGETDSGAASEDAQKGQAENSV